MDMKRVGKAIAQLRKEAGLTQKELADRIGISDKAVSKWERGISYPDITYLGKLANLLDTDSDSLLSGDMLCCEREWQGLLALRESVCNIGLDAMLYDKPLVYYLLGYFLLAGIDSISIACSERDRAVLQNMLGNGDRLGVSLNYCGIFGGSIDDDAVFSDCQKIMLVFDRHLVFGAGLTRFFQRAMSDRKHPILLVNQAVSVCPDERVLVNEHQMIVSADGKGRMERRRNYRKLPIIFAPRQRLSDICRYAAKEADSVHSMCVERLDRGFVDFSLESWDDVAEASAFVRTVQRASGTKLYSIEEIAWRRRMIDKEMLRALSAEQTDMYYGQYLLSLLE